MLLFLVGLLPLPRLGHLVIGRLLSYVWMVRSCVDVKFSIHGATKFGLWQHATHRALDDPNRLTLAHVPGTILPKATRISTVVPVKLLIFLATGQPNSLGVHNDDVVAEVKEWRVAGFVFTLK